MGIPLGLVPSQTSAAHEVRRQASALSPAREAITPRSLALPHGPPREAASPHRVLQPSPYFSHCLSLSHRPRLPGLLRSGLALDAGEGEHCGWGRGRGLAGTACRWAWAPARGICALRAQDDCPGSCRGPQSWLLPRSTARSAPTPRGPLWLSLSPQSPHSHPVPASTAPADTRFLPRCLTRTWRLVGSQDRNVVATQGGLTAPEQS